MLDKISILSEIFLLEKVNNSIHIGYALITLYTAFLLVRQYLHLL